jgi:hypothetical protein
MPGEEQVGKELGHSARTQERPRRTLRSETTSPDAKPFKESRRSLKLVRIWSASSAQKDGWITCGTGCETARAPCRERSPPAAPKADRTANAASVTQRDSRQADGHKVRSQEAAEQTQ